MTLTKNQQQRIEDIIAEQLEDNSLEDILSEFDIDPIECFMILYTSGYIDTELLETLYETGRS